MRDEYGSANMVEEARKIKDEATAISTFNSSRNGKIVIKGVQDEVSALLNDVVGSKPLDHLAYVAKTSEIKALRKQLNKWATMGANKARYEKLFNQRLEENEQRIESEAAE